MISGRLTTDVDHEAAVAEFFAGKLAEEPERTQAVFARHPIQTDERLDKIQRREVDVLMTDYRLRKAKASLSVLTKRVGFGRNSVVMWELPIPVETGPPNGVLVEAPRAVHSLLPSSNPRTV